MSDWRNLPDAKPQKSWKDLPDVRTIPNDGATGGPSANEPRETTDLTSQTLQGGPTPQEDPIEKAAREKLKYEQLYNSMSNGQWLAHQPPDKQEEFLNKTNANALGQGISVARGVPFVGSHLDELSALLQTKSGSGWEYEKKRDEARRAVNDAVSKNPAGPLIGSLALSGYMPSSSLGRIGFNTLAGASEGIGSAPTMSKAPMNALKDAGTAALLSSALEGGYKVGQKIGPAMERGAENQALKGAGLHGGIGSQQAKMGLDDAEARALGRKFLEEDLIPFGGSKAAVKERAQSMLDRANNSIGAELTNAEVSGRPFNFAEMAAEASKPIDRASKVAQMSDSKARALIQALKEQGTATPGSWQAANRAKSDAWLSARFDEDAPMAAKLYRQAVGGARDSIENQLAREVGPQAADALRRANEKYGVAADALKLAKDAARREQANNTLGLTELLTGVGGATLGGASGHPVSGALGGLATALGANLLRKRGNSTAAVLLNELSGPVGGTAKVLGTGGRFLEPLVVEESNRKGGLLQPYLELLKRENEDKQ